MISLSMMMSTVLLTITTHAPTSPIRLQCSRTLPYLSEQITKLHHTKHHQTYICYRTQRNRGGHVNHSLFWENLAPCKEKGGKGGQLDSNTSFAKAIQEEFGSLQTLIDKFNTATLAIQGSGWGWLGLNSATKKLEIVTTMNQDPLLTLLPIIGIDIWEHAFYLQYLNVKPDYLNAIWNVIDFDEAAKRFDAAVTRRR
ncbi:hypothetical protein ACEPAI_3062 [Sanghuangporus weigelae]